MKTINVSLMNTGTKKREKFTLADLLMEGHIDPVNKIITKRGTPYAIDSFQFEVIDAPVDNVQPVEPAIQATANPNEVKAH